MSERSDHSRAEFIAEGQRHAMLAVIGQGRMGRALSAALRRAGNVVRGPLPRGSTAGGAEVALLCVPDREIANASALIEPGRIVAHFSASSSLELLEPHERFSLHPLMSVIGEQTVFAGATCVIDASSEHSLGIARRIAQELGMHARVLPDNQRALYHAAASVASNFLTTVLGVAERLAAQVGIDREALLPLVQASVDHWAELGAERALTGPISRGDHETVMRQRAAVLSTSPEVVPLWDALTTATRTLAASSGT